MKKTKLGSALIQGLNDIIQHEKGKKKLRTSSLTIPGPAPMFSKKDIARIRKKTFKVSQPVFAAILSVKPATIKAWEQGLKCPSGAANRLLQIISSQPKILRNMVS